MEDLEGVFSVSCLIPDDAETTTLYRRIQMQSFAPCLCSQKLLLAELDVHFRHHEWIHLHHSQNLEITALTTNRAYL